MIYIDSDTKLRVNIYYTYKGFSRLDTPEIRAAAGVVEIAEPTPPEDYSDDLYYRTEQDAEPYVVYTRKSDEQIIQVMRSKMMNAVQGKLESAAQAKGYDGIISACSYAGYENPFQAEAIAFGKWRADVWTYCYGQLDKVLTGKRPMPTEEQIVSELPVLVLP